MAHKAKSFRLDEKGKAIILYTNVEEPAEKVLVDFYLNAGYKPKFEEKKASKTIADMRAELKADEEALKKFNAAYKNKKGGFFEACKIYTAWKKEQKK